MVKAGYGSTILTGSSVTFRGDSVRTAYSASKIGLHSLAMDIATSYRKPNVTETLRSMILWRPLSFFGGLPCCFFLGSFEIRRFVRF